MPTHRGRGATQNQISTRLNLTQSETDGDWLDAMEQIDGPTPKLRTTVTPLKSKTIISRNSSPDIGFNQSLSPYSGCEHGCIYCFARPTHAFHDLSPGLDFETRLFVKPDAPDLLRAELMKPGHKVSPIAMGTNTDPYQPIEKDWKITRRCIEILWECRHPLYITTKSDRILRDLDILSAMAAHQLVAVMISLTTLDPAVARTLEPRATHPLRRVDTIRQLSAAGIPVVASVSPIIPAITDHEIEAIVARVAQAGARDATFIPIRLPHEVAPLFRDWLAAHYPDRAAKVMSIIREMRGGRDNDPDFGTRMRGQGVWADLIRTRFSKARRRAGFSGERVQLRTDLFRPSEGDQPRLL